MGFKITAAGDAMMLADFPGDGYLRDEICSFIQTGDARLINVEMVLSNGNCYASTYCGGQWICSNPKHLDDLKTYGFNMFGCANNHSMDYSYEGLLETKYYFEDKGIPYAGIGKDLEEASDPCYFSASDEHGNQIKVAMVSFTTTFIDAARAGESNHFFKGRPGINAVRSKTVYYISEEDMIVLKSIAAKTYINGERDNARKIGSLPPEDENCLNFGGAFFEVGNIPGKSTQTDSRDEKRILNTIKASCKQADYVIVLGHSHQIKHTSYTEPDYFVEDLYRKCIDAGASCVIGSGTHQMKPIEIYHGKPIFYSLGNFIFQTHLVDKLPSDFWDKYQFKKELSLKDALEKKFHGGKVGLIVDRNNYISCIPLIEFEGDVITQIVLKPIELCFDGPELMKGLPRAASMEIGKQLQIYLQDISSCYGTKLYMEGDLIKIEL
ncbi:CapA family protein [Blautia producta]|uniref:CapA family protein n=1 Tax=Blautia producta TaxID=33035 RepID=UPI000495A526